MPSIRFHLPAFVRRHVDAHYIDISLSRVLPLAALIVFGLAVGVVFNHGLSHPFDKVLHVAFYGLLTLSIHAFFCCRLRISALVAFGFGIGGEILQAFIPGRDASLLDAAANGIGVALVVFGIALWRSEQRRLAAEAESREQLMARIGPVLNRVQVQRALASSLPSSRGVSDR
ncbi:VanZ family protein [Pannonibacter sp.]|uniref:VanZ family protein n=1 Tax=Pannonibacter sp. TaxID=1906786 RepID=UPI003F6F2430